VAVYEESIRPEDDQGNGELICAGIWGGIRDLDQDISAGPLIASLYSSSADGGKGGDICYFGVCRGDEITRVAIADVAGHGEAVSGVSQYIHDSLKAHMCDPDSGRILADVNRLAERHGLRAMTTAAVVAYHADSGEFRVSSAGHPPVVFKPARDGTWTFAVPDEGTGAAADVGFPLAVVPDADYSERTIPAASGDRLFVYTDGVTEAPSRQGELFGRERLLDVLDANGDARLSELKSAVVQALHRHAGSRLTHDDVTLIAMQVR
jgi:sigma-B regulation protein RsbU (phosphoserine phosphatase)